ncbi:uncharacterized protein MYCFIDRAFT_213837 [Pseudocercospora fijiensis CIRAD86]|uniref:Uncharacterized protein n=1 Tax=Pseudocercospora fijiensis (strain CIRAD86) TaxID=383855 RepID=M3B7T0_PSEFD|nr:uncharacterized protein MYCFIDRAFT_213837 [Pseudocercospora fijiensis CIRAD86]EME85378.1 hypothetical protein MYCFIDRAFT_213837 [Pseudocercospora fijiensis CIRAD86]
MSLLTLAFAFAATLTNALDPSCTYTTTTRHSIPNVLFNWGQAWRGNWTAWNETVLPNVAFYTDRIPIPFNSQISEPWDTQFIPITNASTLRAFIERTREGFDRYGFVQQFHFVEPGGGKLVTRWTLNATVGAKSSSPYLLHFPQLRTTSIHARMARQVAPPTCLVVQTRTL